jgi:transposase
MRAAVEALSDAVVKGKPGVAGRPKVNEARDAAIYNQVSTGHTYAEVASAFSVSLVRVGQIVAQQRAMRGINPREELLKRNTEILNRLADGESRMAVAAAFNVSRSVVDYLVSQTEATQPRPTRVLPQMPAKVQPETFKVKTSEPEAQAEDGAPTQPAKPRYVMPALEALKAQQADALPIDTRTAKERDVFNPEFGF